MQVTENNQNEENMYEFMKSGVLSLKPHYSHPKDIAQAIQLLQSTCAIEYIHTINVSTHTLYKYDDLWVALKVFMRKTDKIIALLLSHHYIDIMAPRCRIDTIIKILCEFKNVVNLALILIDIEHSVDEIQQLKQYFSNFTTIKNLRLESDYRTTQSIMKSIESYDSIETIDLVIRDIKDVVGLTPVPMAHKIKKIHFSYCGIDSDHMKEFNTFLERSLASNPTICTFSLYDVSINTNTVMIISDFIKTCDDLTTLSMRLCHIDDERIDILAEALKTSNVERLYIDRNDIGCKGAKSIASMLRTNKSLKAINIDDNPITYKGIIKMLKVLAINSNVYEFCCANTVPLNGETVDSIQQTFERILSDNYALVHFDVCLELEVGNRKSKVRVKLKNITDRNKSIIDGLRFARTKLPAPIVGQLSILF